MKKKYTYLSDAERSEIEILSNKGYSMRDIATVLDRSPNTISYELKRMPQSNYRAHIARTYARTQLKNRRFQWRKIDHGNEMRRYIIYGLQQGWNPDEIAGRMKYEKKDWYVSKTSIYTWLETVRGERYKQYLYAYRKGRRLPRKRGLQGRIQHMVSIHKRPWHVFHRKQVGHWETDLVVSNRSGRGALSGHVERVSRYLVVNKVHNHNAPEKQKTLTRLTREFLVRSITFDRGLENARHYELNIPTYFCDPYRSNQKGSIENSNKSLRRYFPKGTNFSKVSEEKIQKIVTKLNNKPRKILGYMTATEVAMQLGVINKGVLIEG